MEFIISFDLRAPDFGAPRNELYAAALDMCEWADQLGLHCVGLGEHHASEDGYLPSPVPFAAAIAARTEQIVIRPNVLLAPLYDPIKLAEDLAVVQILSNNRLQVVIGAGYRPYEFQMFGTRREDRKAMYMQAFEVLRRAWLGREFEFAGRRVTVTPTPQLPPPLLLGGAHPAVARRAARIADGFYPPNGENWDVYRQERLRLGASDPGPSALPLGPIYVYISEEPERDWSVIAPHAAHCVRSYSAWTREAYGKAAGPFAKGVNPDDLRASGAYQVVTAEQCVELINQLGFERSFILTPLLGGLDPDFAWRGLRRFEEQVWPHVKQLAAARQLAYAAERLV